MTEWTRLWALVLMGLTFAFLGVWLRDQDIGRPFFAGDGLAWLRPTGVMYVLALVCGIAAEIVFLGIDALSDPVKVLISLGVGIGLVVAVARRARTDDDGPATE